MRILFNTPFKPLDHPRLSGDVTIARDLMDYLKDHGHEVQTSPFVPCTWIFWKPWLWPRLVRTRRRAWHKAQRFGAEIVLTYHSYYKAPDLIGPYLKSRGLRYGLFSGAYAAKRAKTWKTLPGYLLNKRALLAADHIFSNKPSDHGALHGLVPEERRTFVGQGVPLERFGFFPRARAVLRREWLGEAAAEQRPVLVTAAVLRPGVKVDGVEWVIRCVAELVRLGLDPLLVVAGDGPGRERLEALAAEIAPGRVRFLGLVPRDDLKAVFSAGDVFAFPGIHEGLGMVYLEAQACGLPVVATTHAGAKDVIRHEKTGYLVPPFDMPSFAAACFRLMRDRELCRLMGQDAVRFVRREHDIQRNYFVMESLLQALAERGADASNTASVMQGESAHP
ncbi:glycosyltransferase family 4 protein [Desulfonatronum thioautotrophicum]|uniref:glycosyltransferase family 4 protein n=1 Tax=Desulfonatronum thioautotrophicum TaxID=617001 RepID=UPI0005EB3B59|nr:glycosyltransferase family 4 protein [Desulfonatronum thioautotrophicum]